MTTFARGAGTAAPAEADALIKTLHEDLSRLSASAQLDAVLFLLKPARLMLHVLGRARGELTGEDLDHVRATMRAASLSVRSYLWRTGDSDPVARERGARKVVPIAAQAMNPAHTSSPAPNSVPVASTPSASGANADTPRPTL